MRARRAQSSVEYLGTYAWAFMGLLITLGAMSYFGIFDPSTYTPDNCDSGRQIECTDYLLSVNQNSMAAVYFEFRNNYARDITILNLTITNRNFDVAFPGGPSGSGIIIRPGRAIMIATVSSDQTYNTDGKYDFDYIIYFKRSGGTSIHNKTGHAHVEAVEGAFSPTYGGSPYGIPIGGEPYCGDGTVDDGLAGTTNLSEECDPPNHDETPNLINWYHVCGSDCKWITWCGDDIVQGVDEDCEDNSDCPPGQPTCNDCICF